MYDTSNNSIHWSFWAIGLVTLLWNALGVVNYLWQMNPDAVAAMPDTHRAIIEGRPIWATGAVALAVFGGAIGCVLLLFRKSAAFYFFVVSFIGVVMQLLPHVGIVGSVITDSAEIILMIIMPVVVAVFLVWYANMAQGRGWIS